VPFFGSAKKTNLAKADSSPPLVLSRRLWPIREGLTLGHCPAGN
jgi:hypothetical protein